MYVCMYICIYMYVYLYIERERERERERYMYIHDMLSALYQQRSIVHTYVALNQGHMSIHHAA